MSSPIWNTLAADSPHRVRLFDPTSGKLVTEMQSSSILKCQREAVDHAREYYRDNPDAFRLLFTNTAPDQYKLEVQENTAEGKIIALVAEIEGPWMTPS